MASMGKGAITIRVLIVLCLALVSCEAQGRGGHGGVSLRGGVGLRGGVDLRGGGPGAGLGKEFNVMQFGALPGGKADSTQAFIKAWVAACSYTASARVVIPQGVFKVAEVIFSGPCTNPNPMLIQVIGTVIADSDPSSYPDKGWITISQVDGVRVFGGGTFDGQGQNMWKYDDCRTDPNCVYLPAALYLENVKNARIQWLSLVNAMGFHMHISDSQNIRVNRVTINSPAESPNTDGIHISRSQTVNIGRTSIATGDDCISIGQGAMNVSIKQVTCGPGHGISVGSLGRLPNEMDVRGVLVTNCTFLGTTNGARIKTFAASGASRASAIVFDNLIMNNVQNPINIDQFYDSDSSAKPSLVKISDVTFQNIRGTTASPVAVNLVCSKLVPCDLKFNNINLKSSGPVTSACTNAQVQYTGIQVPPPCK